MLCTVKCCLCGNWMSAIKTPNGKPHLYCGVCRYGILLVTKEAMDNFNSSCQQIQESNLPNRTLEYYRKKVGGNEREEEEV